MLISRAHFMDNILFADDTTMFLSDKDVNVLYDFMNNELQEVCNWFKYNISQCFKNKSNVTWNGLQNEKC